MYFFLNFLNIISPYKFLFSILINTTIICIICQYRDAMCKKYDLCENEVTFYKKIDYNLKLDLTN